MNTNTARAKSDGAHPLRGKARREVQWLLPCAAANMAICLTYLAYRTKHVFSSPDATLLIWATLAIEIAIAGKQTIVEISSSVTRLTIPSSTLTLPAIDF